MFNACSIHTHELTFLCHQNACYQYRLTDFYFIDWAIICYYTIVLDIDNVNLHMVNSYGFAFLKYIFKNIGF